MPDKTRNDNTDKNAAIKYLDGRKKAYSHLFTEISPPIPKEYEKSFMVHEHLLPGYVTEKMQKAQEAAKTENISRSADKKAVNPQGVKFH